MDEHSLQVLELDAIRALLADETSFAGGHELAVALAPSTDPIVVARRQAETAEAVLLIDGGAPRLAGAHDVRPAATAAVRSAVLQPDQLAAIADTARAGLDVRRVLGGRDDVPRLTRDRRRRGAVAGGPRVASRSGGRARRQPVCATARRRACAASGARSRRPAGGRPTSSGSSRRS